MTSQPTPKQFDIYWVNLDPTVGKEIKKTRPCVIVSPDELNIGLGTVIVAPLTRTIKAWPFRVSFTHSGSVSSIACDHIRSISKERLMRQDGKLSVAKKKAVLSILQEMFS